MLTHRRQDCVGDDFCYNAPLGACPNGQGCCVTPTFGLLRDADCAPPPPSPPSPPPPPIIPVAPSPPPPPYSPSWLAKPSCSSCFAINNGPGDCSSIVGCDYDRCPDICTNGMLTYPPPANPGPPPPRAPPAPFFSPSVPPPEPPPPPPSPKPWPPTPDSVQRRGPIFNANSYEAASDGVNKLSKPSRTIESLKDNLARVLPNARELKPIHFAVLCGIALLLLAMIYMITLRCEEGKSRRLPQWEAPSSRSRSGSRPSAIRGRGLGKPSRLPTVDMDLEDVDENLVHI